MKTVNEFLAAQSTCPACGDYSFTFEYVKTEGYPGCVEHNCWPCGCGGEVATFGLKNYVSVTCSRCQFKAENCRVESDALAIDGKVSRPTPPASKNTRDGRQP